MTTSVARTFVLVLLVLCLPLTVVGGATAAFDGEAQSERVALQENATADDADENETVRHRNPDEYSGEGDQEELERWLSGWLSGQLESGAIELSEGEYDLAREHVDEEYRDRLEQYFEVSGNEEQSESFDEAQREQQRMTEAIEEYEETKAEYEEAREEGDEERARELARELEALADEIGSSSQEVQDHYDAISEETDLDLSEAEARIEETNRNVQSEQEDVRATEFLGTDLTIETETEDISFSDPMVGAGELRTEDGDPISNEEIRLDIGNQTVRTETDETGAFEFEYRPVSVPVSADSVTVQYVPEEQSVYLGSEADVPVSIEQVEPTIVEPSVDPERVAYGDELTVDSELHVDGEPVDGAPLAVTADDEVLVPTEAENESETENAGAEAENGTENVTVETEDGSFTSVSTIPADVGAGERTVRVEFPFEDRALASVEAETTVAVDETEPDLSVSASRTGERDVTANGTLEVDGTGIEGQSVQLVAGGTLLETLTTDENGEFGDTVTLPEDAAEGDVQIVAVHDDDGTNLARTEAATTVSFPTSDSLLPTWAWLALGLGALVAVGGAVYWYRNATGEAPAPVEHPDERDPAPTSATSDRSTAQALLSQAAEQLSRGAPDTAVQNGYAAVRATLDPQVNRARALTHWEFYQRYRERESESGRTGADDPLRDVTAGYERAAFGHQSVSEREAETLLERARELCEFDDVSQRAPSDD